ncbi:Pyridoxine 5'-phosphate synthase [Candidatus Magnetoovum chiemensis]|nr:Pyridoxine 5'-phosphate synthase [Candidatus Magnetoovum chiemensis]
MILSVNVDHIATLRQARLGAEPDPVTAAALAILGGADGITAHLREDRRHVNDKDIARLREIALNIDFNLEMAATEEMIQIALEIKPDSVTLVPEKRQELTTEGGLDVAANFERICEAVEKLNASNIPVSLFINPTEEDVETSKKTGANIVEIHTGVYSNSKTVLQKQQELDKITIAVQKAKSLGLQANAGHGLNYSNVRAIASISYISGLYIGHSIVSRAALVGMEKAVRQMKELIS